jgi:hypothetical protein
MASLSQARSLSCCSETLGYAAANPVFLFRPAHDDLQRIVASGEAKSPMTASGPKQTCWLAAPTSAFGSRADVGQGYAATSAPDPKRTPNKPSRESEAYGDVIRKSQRAFGRNSNMNCSV